MNISGGLIWCAGCAGGTMYHTCELKENPLHEVVNMTPIKEFPNSVRKIPHKCPVCSGTGKTTVAGICSRGPVTETCRACDGKSIVWG